ncbi:MAG: conjugal transfer protein TraX [Butyrivibrio sp.]|nr:conjugal transfer protein TraX [Butyrivibrio sp.]MBR4358026.1 conjugal transfer protein TraX [Butyrivibrio sp.]MCR4997309.1 conjugal transfer protein TraX [Butyrivibrio sp.]MEE3471776.1 TraX family protein [Butyrivibrio hungatei]
MDKFADFRKISGNTLKMIALVTMLIDHIGAAVIAPLVEDDILPVGMSFDTLNTIYKALRFIGRTSFPIFIFLITEGFIHTSNRLKYAASLLIFALISELPYDYAFYGKIDLENSNVFITLFLALITLCGVDAVSNYFHKKNLNTTYAMFASIIIILITSAAASLLQSDYKCYGIFLAVIFCFFRPIFPLNILAAYIVIASYSTEWQSFPAFILIFLYNQKQGKKLGKYKYLLYAFYPVHLIILYVTTLLIAGALSN